MSSRGPKDVDVLKCFVCTEGNGTPARAIAEFDASLQGLRPSTKRLYLAGAKALLRAALAGPTGPRGTASYEELWALTCSVKLPKPARYCQMLCTGWWRILSGY